jgi:hypothetical protein
MYGTRPFRNTCDGCRIQLILVFNIIDYHRLWKSAGIVGLHITLAKFMLNMETFR